MQFLPDEILMIIFIKIEDKTLGRITRVARKFTELIRESLVWINKIHQLRPNLTQLETQSQDQLVKLYQKITRVGSLYISFYDRTNYQKKIDGFDDILQISGGTEPFSVDPWIAFITKMGKLYVFFLRNNQIAKIDIGNEIAVQISCGRGHLAFLTDKGEVYLWGNNECGQLGLGHVESRDYPTRLPEFTDVVQVSCGNKHTALITKDGKLFTWGWNKYGQLALGDHNDRWYPTLVTKIINHRNVSAPIPSLRQVSCGHNNLAIVSSDGYLYRHTDLYKNILTVTSNLPNVMAAQSGKVILATTKEGSVYCCTTGCAELISNVGEVAQIASGGSYIGVFRLTNEGYVISKYGNLFLVKDGSATKISLNFKVIDVTVLDSYIAYIGR